MAGSLETRKAPLKCVAVGDCAVGKTSLLITYTNQFPTEYVPTVFDNLIVSVGFGNKTIDLGLWDTIGHDDHHPQLRPLVYPQTDVFLICFSIASSSSFDSVRTKWLPEITHHCLNAPILLVGTKTDLRNEGDANDEEDGDRTKQRLIGAEQGERLAKEIGAIRYLECSAKTQEGIENVFHEVVRVALDPPGSSNTAPSKTRKCSLV